MKTRHYILLAIGGLIAFLAGFFIGKDRTEKPPCTVTETRETTVDTIPYYAPMPQSELVSGTHLYTLPVYSFLGGGYGGEPRQRHNNDRLSIDATITAHNDTGDEGKPQCCGDSAIAADSELKVVELPIIQRHYADSTYEAWISGPVDPQLDSVKVFAPATIITRQEWKPPKRWHIGPTIGYGYTPQGFQPYIGISVTYSIIDL
jgi:hypothetical protein